MPLDNILELHHITKQFPGVLALDDVTVSFQKGKVHAIVGENGAGKSTLMKILSGAYTPDKGEIIIDGQSYRQMSPQIARKLKIEIVYQEFNQFPTLSVAENLFAGELKGKEFWIDKTGMEKEAANLFYSMGVEINPKALIRELSVAEQQLVEIGRAIRKGARVIIMDEPTAPLTVREVEILFTLLEKLKSEGVTIIYISHRLDEIFRISDHVTVMRDGKVVGVHNTSNITKEDLIREMIGRKISEMFPKRSTIPGKDFFEVRKLSGNGVSDINFTIRKGEILGVGGLVGAGRTEMARLIFGAERMDSGEILMDGKQLKIKSPKDALKAGIAYASEDRKRDGLFLELSVSSNIAIASIDQFCTAGVVNYKKQTSVVKESVEKLRIITPSVNKRVKYLSGGNQQKVVLAKWLISNIKMIIFDEPTRGIDVGAKQEIYNLMNYLTENGITILMISSDMEELIGMSDRILVLYERKQMGIINREDFSQELIMTLASGYQTKEGME